MSEICNLNPPSFTRHNAILAGLVIALAAEPGLAQSPCDADLNDDGIVAGADLALVLGDWGPCRGCQGDATNNGVVDGIDLAFVLTLWGGDCLLPWGTVLEEAPDPAIVFDADVRRRIAATGLPWRVRDNGTGIELLLVPPGTFDMGCSASSFVNCQSWESPVHPVTLTAPVYIGRYEVMQSQWTAVMGSNPSYFQGVNGGADSPSRPVESVSWNTIQGFLTATGLRLPTEAEWEYSCRAGTITAFHSMPGYPNGTNDELLAGAIAWYQFNAQGETHPVGQKAPNTFGLHDMPGNVEEWVNDRWGVYPSAPQVDPTGPASGSTRVLRGGSFLPASGIVRSSARNLMSPTASVETAGFRVARNP